MSLTLASPNTMYVSDAGHLNTSGLLITNKMFLDFLMVTLVTPVTCFKPVIINKYVQIIRDALVQHVMTI